MPKFKSFFRTARGIIVTTLGSLASIAGIVGLLLQLEVIGPNKATPLPPADECSKIPIKGKVWEIDLLKPPLFKYFLYYGDSTVETKKRLSDESVAPKVAANGLQISIHSNTVLEMSRPLDIPRCHLGHIVLSLALDSRGGISGPTTLYILVKGKDPVILDTFYIRGRIDRRYAITALAGQSAELLIKTSALADQGLPLTILDLTLKSCPDIGAVIIQAIQSWDGENLDGYMDDFWFNVYKVEKEPLFLRTVRMARDGFTKIHNLQDGEYIIKGMFHSIVLGELQKIYLREGIGIFEKFYVPQAIPLEVKVLYSDGTIGIPGVDIVVTTNASEIDVVRGGGDPPYKRILTDKHGVAVEWLYPSQRESDFYIIHAIYEGWKIGRMAYNLKPGPGSTRAEKLAIVSSLEHGK